MIYRLKRAQVITGPDFADRGNDIFMKVPFIFLKGSTFSINISETLTQFTCTHQKSVEGCSPGYIIDVL